MNRFSQPNCLVKKFPSNAASLPYETFAMLSGWIAFFVGLTDHEDLTGIQYLPHYMVDVWLVLALYSVCRLSWGFLHRNSGQIATGSLYVSFAITFYGLMAVMMTSLDSGWVRLLMGLSMISISTIRLFHLRVTSLNVEEYLAAKEE